MITAWVLVLAALVGTAAPASAAPRGDELAHDDGKQDDRRSSAGSGHVVRFERPSEEFVLTGVRLHGSRYGGGYDPLWTLARVHVRDESMKILARSFVSYDSWKVGREEWVEVPVGPLRVPTAFFVSVEYFPTRRKGIYQSIDEDGSGHSWDLSGSDLGSMLETGEWMIRAVGSKKALKLEQADPGNSEEIARGEGELLDQRSTAGSGHAVLFKQPKKKPMLTGFALFGGRYGSGYEPDSTFFHVFVCDKKLKPLYRTAFPYSSFGTGLEWVEFELPPLKVPKDFALLVYFDPTRTKGIYIGRWAEKKAASITGLPGRVHGKTDKGKGWMIMATCAASAGKLELPALGPAEAGGEEGLDALALAELIEGLDRAELDENVEQARELAGKLAGERSEQEPTAFEVSEHFFLRSDGVDEKTRAALLGIMECAHHSLTTRFGFEKVSAVDGKRIHLRLDVGRGKEAALFTSPGSPDYSLIVFRGRKGDLRAFPRSGKHVVYGFCHELGHVLMGWEDSEHQWAHYLGSYATSDVHEKLGDRGWADPYDYHSIEGLPRFEEEIENAEPGVGEAKAVAKLFDEIGKRFGQERYGPAIAWIIANREGKPFSAVKLYLLADLAAALVEQGCDPGEVEELFGK